MSLHVFGFVYLIVNLLFFLKVITPYIVTSPPRATADIDYSSDRLPVQFAPGQDSASVRINIIDDEEEERNEMFRLRLAIAEGPGVVDDAFVETFITIIDDETEQHSSKFYSNILF